jgi:hypothetical protein
MKVRSPISVACLLGLFALSLAPHAAASTTFPEALRGKLGLAELPYPPLGCQLCHQDDKGGLLTATKPFGRSVRKEGAVGGSVPSRLAALKTLEAAGTASDGDGSGDIAELKAGTDPNVALSSTGEPLPMDEIPLPETGCGLAHAGGASPSAWALLQGALWFAVRRRRTR